MSGMCFGGSFDEDGTAKCMFCKYKKERTLPDPSNYIIDMYKIIGKFLLVAITYHGCTNFDGKKILVFHNTTIEKLKKQGKIDPHFFDDPNIISPIARFVPTLAGWNMAKALATLYCVENRDVHTPHQGV
jgi:hypothetical protein